MIELYHNLPPYTLVSNPGSIIQTDEIHDSSNGGNTTDDVQPLLTKKPVITEKPIYSRSQPIQELIAQGENHTLEFKVLIQ